MRAVVVTVLALALVAHDAAADGHTEAEQLYDRGQAAFDANQFDDAVSAWERSFELSREPGLLFNLGQAYRRRGTHGDCAKARDAYKKFLELDATSDQRAIAQGFLTEMERCVASEAAAQITVPRVHPSPVERVEPLHRSHTMQIVGLAIAGGGVASLATGIYFGHRASVLGREVTDHCATGCDWASIANMDADGRSAQTKQWVFDGVGAAALAAGGILFWFGSRETSSPIAITSGRDRAAITWSGSW